MLRDLLLDRTLLVILAVAFLLGIHGADWGRVEPWEPDQMAFRSLLNNEGAAPLNPGWFHKPPFLTYTHFFLSTVPIGVAKKLGFPAATMDAVRLLWSRTLTVFMFLGCCIVIYRLVRDHFGLLSARLTVAIFATSAGFIAFSHFLTADIPVLWWMLLAFYFSCRILDKPTTSHYVLAGFLTGVATATKYNGLAIGIAFAIAHFLRKYADPNFEWRSTVLNPKLIAALASVVIGFVICNPYAVLDYQTFVRDFIYNYKVTPIYGGDATGHSYGKFLTLSTELFGHPASLLLLVSVLASFYYLFRRDYPLRSKHLLLVAYGTFLLYYAKFGAFSRLETRFVLPVYPLLLLPVGLLLNQLKPWLARVVVVPILIYGIVCSIYVGKRFSSDPTRRAEAWVMANVPPDSTIESTPYTPRWSGPPGSAIKNVRAPTFTGRGRLFESLLTEDSGVLNYHKLYEKDDGERWYTYEELARRGSDYVAVNSRYYDRWMESRAIDQIYPSMRTYFSELLDAKYPYRIVFDVETENPPSWIYPQEIDLLANRMIILKRVAVEPDNPATE